MRKIMRSIPWLIAACLMLIACNSTIDNSQSLAAGQTNHETATSTSIDISTEIPALIPNENSLANEPTPDRTERIFVTAMPEIIDPSESPESAPIVGEVPEEILSEIIADLASQTGADEQTIEVIRSQAVNWNDGSLGCPKPGEFYTQAYVNGYWVVLEIEGEQYDYRAAETGYFFRCEGKFRSAPPQGTPES